MANVILASQKDRARLETDLDCVLSRDQPWKAISPRHSERFRGLLQQGSEVRAKGGISGSIGFELAGGEAEFDGEAEGIDEFGVAGA